MESLQPLKGKLVLDLSQGIAAPYCGRLLAEHGARVIKVEPPGGDWVRNIGGGPGDVSVNFLYYNFGKESIELDLKTSEGVEVAKRIAAKADVMLESARPGATDRLGLGFEAIRDLNPRIIYLSVSGFGQQGPRGHEPMTDTVAQAYTGMMSVNHGMDGIPHKINTTIVDAITGLYAYQQVAMALMAGGEAPHLDVSLMQSAAAVMGPKVMEFAHFGMTPASPNAPAGSYRTSDGWIAVTLVRESHFAAIAKAVGKPELATDPRFDSFDNRLKNLDEIKAILNDLTEQKTTAEWVEIFAEQGVLASPIHDYGDWLADAQVVATQGAPEQIVHGDVTSPPPRTPGRVPFDRPAPASGQDTARVLAEFAE